MKSHIDENRAVLACCFQHELDRAAATGLPCTVTYITKTGEKRLVLNPKSISVENDHLLVQSPTHEERIPFYGPNTAAVLPSIKATSRGSQLRDDVFLFVQRITANSPDDILTIRPTDHPYDTAIVPKGRLCINDIGIFPPHTPGFAWDDVISLDYGPNALMIRSSERGLRISAI